VNFGIIIQALAVVEHFGASVDSVLHLLLVAMGLESVLLAVMKEDVVSYHLDEPL